VIRQTAIAIAILIAVAVGISVFVARQRRRGEEPMRVALLADIDEGSCAGLRRAQVLARRLALANGRDAGSHAALALSGALLAVDCGLPLTQDVAELVQQGAGVDRWRGGDERAVAGAAAARALWRLAAGKPAEAIKEGEAAVAAAPSTPEPLYALGRARARAGDLVGASRALEAAMVAGPAFLPARLAWAEVRLDLGDGAAAAEALRALPSPDLRARLLLDEVERALGATAPATTAAAGSPAASLDAACDQPHFAYALEGAGCALREATRARLAGDRRRACARAVAAAELAPEDPRLLARVAQLLAEMGAVDRAAALVARAERLAAPDMPALAWAALGVALGRGRAAVPPAAPPPPAPEGPLLEVRAALATGGIGALAAVIGRGRGGAGAGAGGEAPDPDRDAFAHLRDAAVAGGATVAARSDGPGKDDPLRAYVAGLRARLAGDLDSAAEHFSRALSGHGDACRAAGEYVATLRALKRKADASAFTALRAENAGCVNLPR
jgi:tetratricopeptide (TPR) repeat protein